MKNQIKQNNLTLHTDLKESTINVDDNVIENVAILSQNSVNGRIYSDEVQVGALDLFENMKSFKDHGDVYERKIDDLIGKFNNVKFNKNDHKTYGDLKLIENTNIATKLKEIAKSMPEVAGISIHVAAKYHLDEDDTEIIDEIVKAYSGDLVIEPATTKGLFENVNKEKESDMEIKDLTLELIRERKPSILSDLDETIKDLKETINDLKESNKSLKKENDKMKSEVSKLNKEAFIDKKVKESDIPSELITESFKKTLLFSEKEEIENVINDFAEGVKDSGVKFNHEKIDDSDVELNDNQFLNAMRGVK